MIIVTGGAGMIGSNIILALNKIGIKDIIVVDDMTDGRKFINIADLDFQDYIDKEEFLKLIKNDYNFGKVKTIFHQGACSSTTEWDGRFLMFNNYEYSKILLNWSQKINAQFIFASSASVYGLGKYGFRENISCESPINPYAFSKFCFDKYLREVITKAKTQIVSLRYFNVYGPREKHKDKMASTILHFHNQVKKNNICKLFKGSEGYKNGEQMRDFIFVEDCADVNIWFMENPLKSGIFNVGTGQARTFNSVALNVLKWHKKHNSDFNGSIEYIDFPKELLGSYQNYTKANLDNLRLVGYKKKFTSLEEGVIKYINWIEKN